MNVFRLVKYMLFFSMSVSCTKKLNVEKRMPASEYFIAQNIPKQVPELIVVPGMSYHPAHSVDSSLANISSYGFYIGSFYMSKHEITNKEFCSYLNEDSIPRNAALVKEQIAIGEGENKITFRDGKFHSVEGFDNYPVVMVSWWGAVKYCQWLSAFVNKARRAEGYYPLANYRLPSEFEWVYATALDENKSYFDMSACKSDSMHVSAMHAHNVKKDSVVRSGVAGLNQNVHEWTYDNYQELDQLIDCSMVEVYEEEISDHAVIRKCGINNADKKTQRCWREARLRTGCYSDTGFRIVQTYLGRSSGTEF